MIAASGVKIASTIGYEPCYMADTASSNSVRRDVSFDLEREIPATGENRSPKGAEEIAEADITIWSNRIFDCKLLTLYIFIESMLKKQESST